MIEYKVSLVEESLGKMDASAFQEMCDVILQEEVQDYAYVARIGSQVGKRKTRKGTPDSGFLLRNGKYLLVEYTTQAAQKDKKGLIKKLKEDVQKGLAKFPPTKIERIILAFNSRLTLEEAQPLYDLIKSHKVKLDLLGLDEWAHYLSNRYRYLSQAYLGLPLSSGQVLSLKQFVTSYAAVGFQPGLQHHFFAREADLISLKSSFGNHPLTFVAGRAGIGKSRLCIEAIRQFLAQNLDWSCLCINKVVSHRSVYEELQILFSSGKNYLLFLDDANRQREHLAEVLELLAYGHSGQLRIVATVRDYALGDLQENFSDFAPHVLSIAPLNTEVLTEILKGPDFKISNQKYQNRILKIAQGNTRIVVMLAELALAKQDIEALNDVSQVYDKHFERIKGDCDILSHPTALKVLGLLAFFYSVDTANIERFQHLLHCFSIEEKDFRKYAEALDDLELLEISSDRQAYRFADQTLANYLFYKTFIKEKLLSFEVLLREYFLPNVRRISDHIISASNDFGNETVQMSIHPTLQELWRDWRGDEQLAQRLLDTFWFYMQEECLAHVAAVIDQMPEVENPVFITAYERNDQYENKEPLLDLLNPFLHYHFTNFRTSVELGFEYVARHPKAMPVWIHYLTDRIAFEWEDQRYGFHRQQAFLDCLLNGVNEGKPEYRAAWDASAAYLLKTAFQSTGSGINKNSISISTYPLPNQESIRAFRSQIWNFIYRDFVEYPESCLKILKSYPSYDTRTEKAIFKFDLPFFLKILEERLFTDNFEHCAYVHDALSKLKSLGVNSRAFSLLIKRFTNTKYHTFQVLDRNRFRNQERLGYEDILPWEECEKLKQAEVVNAFQFKNLSDFERFYDDYVFLVSNTNAHNANLSWSFDEILETHFSQNPILALQIVAHILGTANATRFQPQLLLNRIIEGDTIYVKSYFQLLQTNDFQLKDLWLLRFFQRLKFINVDKEYYVAMLDNFRKMGAVYDLNLAHLENYTAFNPHIFRDVLQILLDKYESKNIKFTLWFDFFEKYHHHFANAYLPLLKKTYFLQEQLEEHRDLDCKDWLTLVTRDAVFIVEYFRNKPARNRLKGSEEQHKLGAVWHLDNAEQLIEKAIIETSTFEHLSALFKHSINELFIGMPEDRKERAIIFLENMVEKYCNDISVTQALFHIIRRNFSEHYEQSFLRFISHNRTLDFFQKINWSEDMSRHIISSRGTMWGEREAQRWEKVLGFLDKFSKPTSIVRHKAYIKDRIEYARSRAAEERKRSFQDENF